jgi:spore germination protein YaaH
MASATLRAKLLAAIVAEVDKYHYDGIDLDFENLELANRDAFSAFVADVAREMHARKLIVSIAVLGKRTDKPAWGAAAALDFAALGKSVDRLKIMTYGVHGSFSGPGAIGPLSYAQGCIEYAAKLMPAQKVYLGIPFFGYDWPEGGKATAVTYSSAQTRIAKSTTGVTFSAADGESTFTYTEAGVKHTVWFQDQKGIAAKMALAKKMKIGGVAAWAIGGEGADFFMVLDKGR